MLEDNEKKIITLLGSESEKENNVGLKKLYHDFFPIISQMIFRNKGSKEDAEDIFQESVLVLFHQVKKNNLVLSCKLRTYFYSICRNLWLKKLSQRKVKIEDIQDHESFIAIKSSIIESIELSEKKRAMLELLNHLDEDCRKMLTYFYYEQMKMKEIAIRMNFANDQVARNKKVKCLKKLTSLMEKLPTLNRFFK